MGLEPAIFSLEGRGDYAQWHPSWWGAHLVSSYRVVENGNGQVLGRGAGPERSPALVGTAWFASNSSSSDKISGGSYIDGSAD
jgi:hypothetical protein